MAAERQISLDKAIAAGAVLDRSMGQRASVGHPNRLGHACYAYSILTVLEDILRHQRLLSASEVPA